MNWYKRLALIHSFKIIQEKLFALFFFQQFSFIIFVFVFSDARHSVEELFAMMLNNTRHTAESFASKYNHFQIRNA